MMLIPIKDYENLYSLDTSNNEVYSHRYDKYLKYTIDKNKYKLYDFRKGGNRKKVLLHRLVYQVHNPNEDISKLEIDHIDRDKTNNNIDNLRTATHSHNSMNKEKQSNNKIGFKNICYNPRYKKPYIVQIKGTNYTYNNRFLTLEEALEDSIIKRKELHTIFSCD